MDAEEFQTLMSVASDAELLEICLRADQPPFVFDSNHRAWDAFRDLISTNLNCPREDIRVVGSGRLGISLSPGKNLRRFSDRSDIDVVVINAELFDAFWFALLRAAYPRPPTPTGGWLARRRNELYTGWLTPAQIAVDPKIFRQNARPVLKLRTNWFNTMKAASQFPPRRHEDIRSRLYRTWEHAELYHLHSLVELRRALDQRQ
jgi:hypothetical protein